MSALNERLRGMDLSEIEAEILRLRAVILGARKILRDEIAMSVSDRVLERVNGDMRTEHDLSLEEVCESAAKECYAFADAMLKERER